MPVLFLLTVSVAGDSRNTVYSSPRLAGPPFGAKTTGAHICGSLTRSRPWAAALTAFADVRLGFDLLEVNWRDLASNDLLRLGLRARRLTRSLPKCVYLDRSLSLVATHVHHPALMLPRAHCDDMRVRP